MHKYTRKHSIATRKRDFVFRFLNVGVYTNTGYHAINVKESSSCQYCGEEEQDFNHLFIYCEEITSLRQAIAAKWTDPPTLKEWLIGNEENKPLTFLAFELNQYIQKTNWKGKDLSMADFN